MYKLSKTLYSLRQVRRAWNIQLDESLKNLIFMKCLQEKAVDTRNQRAKVHIISLYVDDLIVIYKSVKDIEEFK